MKSVLDFFVSLIVVVAIVLASFGAGYYYCSLNPIEIEPVAMPAPAVDLEMPGEVEIRKVTVKDVKSSLSGISELSTYASRYQATLEKEETRYFLDNIELLGTTNKIRIDCEGVVKVGYDVSDIKVSINENKIYVSLPFPTVNDNYVIWETVKCTENNNILNPINFDQYDNIITEIEEIGLEDARSNGVFQKAADHMKHLIEMSLSEFEDYEVVFM